MSFKNWKPSLTSNLDKFNWLLRNKEKWVNVPKNVLEDRWSGASQALVDRALVDGLYRRTTPQREIWKYLVRKIMAIRKLRDPRL